MADTVAAIVRREFGASPDHVERADDGLLHDTYFVDVNGVAAVVQLAGRPDDPADSLRRGVGCYRLFRDAPVPVPAVLSDGVETYDGREYTVVQRIPGESAALVVSPERTRAAGQVLARIHANGGRFDETGRLRFADDGTPFVEPFPAGSDRERRRERLSEATETIRNGSLRGSAHVVDALFEDRDLPAADEPVLCHDDCTPDNVLFRGDELTGVIDFDRAYVGDGGRDVVKAANAFWMHEPTAEWSVRESFYEGYRSIRPLPETFEHVEPLYRVECIADTLAGMRELGELTDREATFYDERLADAVERARRG